MKLIGRRAATTEEHTGFCLPWKDFRINEPIQIVKWDRDNFSTHSKVINDSIAPFAHSQAIYVINLIVFRDKRWRILIVDFSVLFFVGDRSSCRRCPWRSSWRSWSCYSQTTTTTSSSSTSKQGCCCWRPSSTSNVVLLSPLVQQVESTSVWKWIFHSNRQG